MVFSGLVLIGLGIGFLLDVGWARLWPVFLVALGGELLVSATLGRKRPDWFLPGRVHAPRAPQGPQEERPGERGAEGHNIL